MTELYNLQRKVKIDPAPLRKFASSLPNLIPYAAGKTFAVALVPDGRMKELNSLFRGKEATTDVLSFPFEAESFEVQLPATAGGTDRSFLGDIVISAEQADRQAKENKLTLENEIKQLILHGLLHLCGYDHETDDGEMNARELELRDKLGI